MLKTTNRSFLTIPECAEAFEFPMATIRTLVKQDAFPVMKVGRTTYIMKETFAQYLASFEYPGTQGSAAPAGSGSTTHGARGAKDGQDGQEGTGNGAHESSRIEGATESRRATEVTV